MESTGRNVARTIAVVAALGLLVSLLPASAGATAAEGARSSKTWELNGTRGDDIVAALDPYAAVVIPGSLTGPAPDRAVVLEEYSTRWIDAKTFTAGDVNGDGYGDLLFGDPDYNSEQGAVAVVPGGPKGPLVDETYLLEDTYVTSTSPRRLGASVAAADLNQDGYDDLITTINTGGRQLPGSESYRDLAVYWGGTTNLTPNRYEYLWRLQADDDLLLTAGDVSGDRRTEVIAVDPGEAPTQANPSGTRGTMWWCTVVPGEPGGYGMCHDSRRTPAGVADITVGDVAGGRRDDVVLTQPGGQGQWNGLLWSYLGTRDGLANPSKLSQDSHGVPGSDEPGDEFGAAVVAGDIDGNGKADLVVGAPGEVNGQMNASGRVTVLFGARKGLGHGGARLLTQESPGIPSRSDVDDRFGGAVSLLDTNGDGALDLVIGAPGENGGRGAITVVPTRNGRPATRASQRITVSDVKGAYYDGRERTGFGRAIGR